VSRILDDLEPAGRNSAGHVVVRLSEDDYRKSFDAGLGRMFENLHKPDAIDYQRGMNRPEHIAQPLGVLAEVAVARHFEVPFDWDMALWKANEHERHRHRPDLVGHGQKFEVKRVNHIDRDVAVNRKDVGNGLTLVVAYAVPPEYLTVKILGWLPYDTAFGIGSVPKWKGAPSTTKRVVPVRQLNRCTCFFPGAKHGNPPSGVVAEAG
jgi:hypothetical protein